jgi:hypothetical protein
MILVPESHDPGSKCPFVSTSGPPVSPLRNRDTDTATHRRIIALRGDL